MKQCIVSMACGCLLAWAAAAQSRVIDSFETSGAGTSGGCPLTQSSGDSTSNPIPNSFPPGDNSLGVIGSTSSTTAERRYDHVRSGIDGSTFSFEHNLSTSLGQLLLDVSPGCNFEAVGTYDGIGTPGIGLNGQNLTEYSGNPECPSPTGLADRFLLDIVNVDPKLQVEISVTDIANNTATLTRTGLQAGQEPFPYADFTNGASTDFSNVDKINVKFSGENVFLALNAIVVSCNPNDLDDDGITDSQDVCLESDLRSTVVGSCDSAVTNTHFPSGCTIADLVADCPTGKKQKACATKLTRQMVALGILTAQQRGAITRCTP